MWLTGCWIIMRTWIWNPVCVTENLKKSFSGSRCIQTKYVQPFFLFFSLFLTLELIVFICKTPKWRYPSTVETLSCVHVSKDLQKCLDDPQQVIMWNHAYWSNRSRGSRNRSNNRCSTFLLPKNVRHFDREVLKTGGKEKRKQPERNVDLYMK